MAMDFSANKTSIGIDLIEVKNTLSSFPGVKNVRLRIEEDGLWGHRIHAEIGVSSEKEITEKEVKLFCSERIALYKIPKSILIRMN